MDPDKLRQRAMDPSYRGILRLGGPAVLTMLSQTLMSFVDAAMVGRLGAAAIAGVGLTGTLIWGMYSFFDGLVDITGTFAAQELGANRPSNATKATWQGLYIGLIGGLFLALLFPLFTDTLFEWMGAAPDVGELGVPYFNVRLRSAPFLIMTMAIVSLYRGIGDMTTPLWTGIAINILNILLDAVLIFGLFGAPKLGVYGAGLATAISNVVGFLLPFGLFIFRDVNDPFIARKTWHLDPAYLWRMVKVGVPQGVMWTLDMGAFIFFSAVIARLGTVSLAANEVGVRLLSLSFMPAYGLSAAGATVMGQMKGAGELALARLACGRVLMMTLFYTALVAAIFLAFSEPLAKLVIDSPEVVTQVVGLLAILALLQSFDGLAIAASGCLRGAGDTRFPMLVMIGCQWGLFFPLGYLFGLRLGLGLHGAWVGGLIGYMVMALLMLLRLRSNRWESKQI